MCFVLWFGVSSDVRMSLRVVSWRWLPLFSDPFSLLLVLFVLGLCVVLCLGGLNIFLSDWGA